MSSRCGRSSPRRRRSTSFRPTSPVVFVTVAEGIAGCELLEAGVRSGPLAHRDARDVEPKTRAGLDDIGSFIRAYLIEGRAAFSLRVTPTVSEAIEAIHAAGGVAIWAHPFWDMFEPQEVLATIERFHALGIDGVEAFYVTHTLEQTELLAERCAERDMLSTGSADFHGPENRLFSRFMAFDTYGLQPNLGPIAALTQAR